MFKGIVIERKDLELTHEEADVIIPKQVVHAATQGSTCIKVINDDTDVFILLVHYYQKMFTDLHSSAACRYRLSAPSCSRSYRCDTVAFMFGIGKAKAVKVFSSGCQLLKIGNPDMAMNDFLQEATAATQFVARCYGHASSESMSSARYEVWLSKTSKRKTGAPKLKSLFNIGSI